MKKNENHIRKLSICVLPLALLLISYSTAALGSAVIHVPKDQTIQAAIDAAADGDTILVDDGIYTGEGNKNLDFGGKELTVKSKNGPEKCIIDCENEGRGFYFHSGELKDAVVSGFTITNGRTETSGGGIYCVKSSPTITHCIIINNFASGDSNGNQGGGIYCGAGSSPTISNCVIVRNKSDYQGGGIYCYNTALTLTNCTITRNTAMDGGGIYYRHKPFPYILNCIIWGNMPNEVAEFNLTAKSPPAKPAKNAKVKEASVLPVVESPLIAYSLVKGGYEGQGNINSDPLFAGTGDYYHLTKESPCINAGFSIQVSDTDIDGDLRQIGKVIDIGADEYSGD